MSRRRSNRKRNQHVITYYWRGDSEDTKTWYFPTQEAAWAHVVGEVRIRWSIFRKHENEPGKGPTIIDWEQFKKDLFEKGEATIEYCQESAWWDNWGYSKRAPF